MGNCGGNPVNNAGPMIEEIPDSKKEGYSAIYRKVGIQKL
jgi:hypothetical protein